MNIVDPIVQRIVKANPIRTGETATAYGTRIHRLIEDAIDALGDPDINAEVSYLNQVASQGRPYLLGSKRPDLVLGPIDRPWAIIDFKTGNTSLRGQWTRALQNTHLPAQYRNVPIVPWKV